MLLGCSSVALDCHAGALLITCPEFERLEFSAGALMRLAADQLVFAPAFIAVFFSSLLILEVCLMRLNSSSYHWSSAAISCFAHLVTLAMPVCSC